MKTFGNFLQNKDSHLFDVQLENKLGILEQVPSLAPTGQPEDAQAIVQDIVGQVLQRVEQSMRRVHQQWGRAAKALRGEVERRSGYDPETYRRQTVPGAPAGHRPVGGRTGGGMAQQAAQMAGSLRGTAPAQPAAPSGPQPYTGFGGIQVEPWSARMKRKNKKFWAHYAPDALPLIEEWGNFEIFVEQLNALLSEQPEAAPGEGWEKMRTTTDFFNDELARLKADINGIVSTRFPGADLKWAGTDQPATSPAPAGDPASAPEPAAPAPGETDPSPQTMDAGAGEEPGSSAVAVGAGAKVGDLTRYQNWKTFMDLVKKHGGDQEKAKEEYRQLRQQERQKAQTGGPIDASAGGGGGPSPSVYDVGGGTWGTK